MSNPQFPERVDFVLKLLHLQTERMYQALMLIACLDTLSAENINAFKLILKLL